MAERTFVHAFTDGRDVSPHAARADLGELVAEGVQLAGVIGRYYAMDRDKRWERTERALAAILHGEGTQAEDAVAAVEASYERDVTDEFIEPVVLPGPRLDPERDAAIHFNFRPDRARQLTEKLLELGVDLVTMTRYRDDFDCPVAFPEQNVSETMAEVLAEHGLRQLHVAETEKYAHVTYFFNGGNEQEWEGETRILVPVASRRPDLRPEAGDVRPRGRRALRGRDRGGLPLRRSSTSPTRTWSATRASSPLSSRRSRPWTRASAASSRPWRRSAASASSRPTTATPSSSSRPTVSARTRRTRRIPCRSS